ncbi:S24 family peptidase [Rhodoferax sp.]|uniref:S24 family peptidase n=1 Tax=Rhodoferax sp. TaxID=50421 RepID=UPI0019FFFC98|nr:S24 family peptidase [Rhodoferax sp.]MBE0472620.1 S24 family peptidase [Rhodoferax sp.]
MQAQNHESTGANQAAANHTEAAQAAFDAALPDCAGGESFALMVQGQSMYPEFQEGEIIIIEPEGLARDGSYVLAWHQAQWTFRQLLRSETGWLLHALNPAFADDPIADLSPVRGVIIQKALPGRRRASKHYI